MKLGSRGVGLFRLPVIVMIISFGSIIAGPFDQIGKGTLSGFYNPIKNVLTTLSPQLRGLAVGIYGLWDTKPVISARAFKISRDNYKLDPGEKEFTVRRDQKCKAAQEKFLGFGKDKKLKKPIRIGFAFSGGGMRAQLSTIGTLSAIDKTNILDMVSYTLSLSGSTWAVAPWNLSNKPPRTFKDELIDRIAGGFFKTSYLPGGQEHRLIFSQITRTLFRKVLDNRPLSIIDFYGILLGTFLSTDERSNYLKIGLETLQAMIADAGRPLPIMTAATPKLGSTPTPSELEFYAQASSSSAAGTMQGLTAYTRRPYSWIEYTPFRVSCPDLGWSVRPAALGSFFDNGVMVKQSYMIPLGTLMGTWGSAFSANLADLNRLVIDDDLKSSLFYIVAKEILKKYGIKDARLMPELINNPGYKLEGTLAENIKQLIVVDAGLDYNVPLKPLFEKERNCDIIVLVDTSGNLDKDTSFTDALNHVRHRGFAAPTTIREAPLAPARTTSASGKAMDTTVPAPTTTDLTQAKNRVVSVLDDGPDSKAPIIIYFPLIKNSKIDQQFDPRAVNAYRTFNLSYSKEDAQRLADHWEKTIAAELPKLLKDAIIAMDDRKARGIR